MQNTVSKINHFFRYIHGRPARLLNYGEYAEYTLLSPLFQSLSDVDGDSPYSIFDGMFQYFYEYQENTYEGSADDFINETLIYMQNHSNHINFVDRDSGEVICTIPISDETINKTVQELFPELLSLIVTGAVDSSPIDYKAKSNEVFVAYRASGDYPSQTYDWNGVRRHRPSMNDPCHKWRGSSRKTARFVSRRTGKTTDEFYGEKNDFNDWFLGNVGKGIRFFVYIDKLDGKGEKQYNQIVAFLNKERLTFKCNRFGMWKIA